MTRYLSALFFLFSALSSSQVLASDPCTSKTSPHTVCKVAVATLRPTQFAVGMYEVEDKMEKVSRVKDDPQDLKNLLKKEAEPVVIGPGPNSPFFIIDHHHMALALLKENVTSTYAIVQANYSDLNWDDFWETMQENKWVYLYNEKGEGPLPISQLPQSLAEMKDDPYRSLSGEVRDRGGYRKTQIPFAEFQWANFFRSRIQLGTTEEEFQKAILAAIALAKTPAAKLLPGFLGEYYEKPAQPIKTQTLEQKLEDWHMIDFPLDGPCNN